MTTRPWSPPATHTAPTVVRISPRLADVLDRLCDGMSNQRIARDLYVTPDTVKTHVSRLYAALGVEGRCQAVAAVCTGRIQVWVTEP
jgi:DNA-binding NarL/FixJ family response regulator